MFVGREAVTFGLRAGGPFKLGRRVLQMGLRTREEGLSKSLRTRGEGAFEEAYKIRRRGIRRGLQTREKGRRRRLHPLGEYFITLYTNGKLRTRVTVMLISGAEGHTPKGTGLRVVDSHTGNHRGDDFTPLETFRGFSCAFGMYIPS
ncbi:hypothetical protein Tco_1477964 [Tanacetum coccineum]